MGDDNSNHVGVRERVPVMIGNFSPEDGEPLGIPCITWAEFFAWPRETECFCHYLRRIRP